MTHLLTLTAGFLIALLPIALYFAHRLRQLERRVKRLEDARDAEIAKRMNSVDWMDDLLGQVKKVGTK